MTSSAGPTSRASSARWRAAVAEFRAIAWRAPTLAANCSSNAFVRAPVVSQPESRTSMTACFSRSVIDGRANGRYARVARSVISRSPRRSRPGSEGHASSSAWRGTRRRGGAWRAGSRRDIVARCRALSGGAPRHGSEAGPDPVMPGFAVNTRRCSGSDRST